MTIRVCMNIYVSRTFQKSGQNSRKVPRKFREMLGKVKILLNPTEIRTENLRKKIPTDFFQKSILTDLLLGHVGTRYERIRDSFRTFSIGIR